MGRIARTFPIGKFTLRAVGNSDNMQAVYLYYYWKGKQLRRSMDIMTDLKDWNQRANGGIGELKKSFGKDYNQKNIYLQNRRAEIDRKITEYVMKNGSISWQTIDNFLNGEDAELRPDQGKDFFEFAYERIDRKKALGGKGTSPSNIENKKSYIKQFENFVRYKEKGSHGLDNELLYISDITVGLIVEFQQWRLREGRKTDTINKGVQTIASVCKDAADLHYLSPQIALDISNLFLKHKNTEADDLNVKYLSQDDMRKLLSVKDSLEHERSKEILEMYQFSFFACGLRLVDVMTLRWKDINFKTNRIKKVLIKTGVRDIVPLCSQAKEILEHWRGRNSVYVFDLLSENFDLDDENALYQRRNSITHTLNTSLKRSCQKAGIPEHTFHSARHSWAVYALEKGTEINKISCLLGHTTTAMTERVYAEFLPKTLDKAVEDLTFDFD